MASYDEPGRFCYLQEQVNAAVGREAYVGGDTKLVQMIEAGGGHMHAGPAVTRAMQDRPN